MWSKSFLVLIFTLVGRYLLKLIVNFILTQEWRHAHGMRCLGIPNTAHFANVTLIEDAVACTVHLFIYLFFSMKI